MYLHYSVVVRIVVLSLNHVQPFVIPWMIACQAPLSMGFSRQKYWSWLPFPSPEDLSDRGIKPTSLTSPTLQADSLLFEPPGKPLTTWQVPKPRNVPVSLA